MPDITTGTSGSFGSPVFTAVFGGRNVVSSFQAFARHRTGEAADETYQATNSSLMGGHARQLVEWQHQENLASKELLQIEAQITAAEIREALATTELENHDAQIEDSAAVEEML